MGDLFVYGDLVASAWDFVPLPGLDFDLAVTDCFVAEAICKNEVTRPDSIISIWDHNTHAHEKYPFVDLPTASLVLEFDDVLFDKPFNGYVAPKESDILPIVAAAMWPDNFRGRILVHCGAGISRSAAVALILIAQRLGPHREGEAIVVLLEAIQRTEKRGWRTGSVSPNRTVLEIGDRLLGRDGRLVEAWDKIENRYLVSDP